MQLEFKQANNNRATGTIDSQDNVANELVEKSTDNITDYSWHMSKVRFIEYVEYYYDDITCRGDGIPNLIK